MNIPPAYPGWLKGRYTQHQREYHVDTMGFNPFRGKSTTPIDIALVVGAVAVTLVLVLWAAFG